jgi:RND superfamily putative drug exporter
MIMFSIFVAFMFTNDPTIKAIGFSFAAGVFLDAFVVRLTLVPAVMAIIRSKLWYHPEWFAKYIPDPDIEGLRLEHELAVPETRTTVRLGSASRGDDPPNPPMRGAASRSSFGVRAPRSV